ncbi:hypothetical protein HanPI659440_Chr08g0314701 [Helianthus annuus]|nr:hypothetical protein HanPI659440_Chr08g0314701 [Helianthus annuus]
MFFIPFVVWSWWVVQLGTFGLADLLVRDTLFGDENNHTQCVKSLLSYTLTVFNLTLRFPQGGVGLGWACVLLAATLGWDWAWVGFAGLYSRCWDGFLLGWVGDIRGRWVVKPYRFSGRLWVACLSPFSWSLGKITDLFHCLYLRMLVWGHLWWLFWYMSGIDVNLGDIRTDWQGGLSFRCSPSRSPTPMPGPCLGCRNLDACVFLLDRWLRALGWVYIWMAAYYSSYWIAYFCIYCNLMYRALSRWTVQYMYPYENWTHHIWVIVRHLLRWRCEAQPTVLKLCRGNMVNYGGGLKKTTTGIQIGLICCYKIWWGSFVYWMFNVVITGLGGINNKHCYYAGPGNWLFLFDSCFMGEFLNQQIIPGFMLCYGFIPGDVYSSGLADWFVFVPAYCSSVVITSLRLLDNCFCPGIFLSVFNIWTTCEDPDLLGCLLGQGLRWQKALRRVGIVSLLQTRTQIFGMSRTLVKLLQTSCVVMKFQTKLKAQDWMSGMFKSYVQIFMMLGRFGPAFRHRVKNYALWVWCVLWSCLLVYGYIVRWLLQTRLLPGFTGCTGFTTRVVSIWSLLARYPIWALCEGPNLSEYTPNMNDSWLKAQTQIWVFVQDQLQAQLFAMCPGGFVGFLGPVSLLAPYMGQSYIRQRSGPTVGHARSTPERLNIWLSFKIWVSKFGQTLLCYGKAKSKPQVSSLKALSYKMQYLDDSFCYLSIIVFYCNGTVCPCRTSFLLIPRRGCMVSYFWSPKFVLGDMTGGMPPLKV